MLQVEDIMDFSHEANTNKTHIRTPTPECIKKLIRFTRVDEALQYQNSDQYDSKTLPSYYCSGGSGDVAVNKDSRNLFNFTTGELVTVKKHKILLNSNNTSKKESDEATDEIIKDLNDNQKLYAEGYGPKAGAIPKKNLVSEHMGECNVKGEGTDAQNSSNLATLEKEKKRKAKEAKKSKQFCDVQTQTELYYDHNWLKIMWKNGPNAVLINCVNVSTTSNACSLRSYKPVVYKYNSIQEILNHHILEIMNTKLPTGIEDVD